MVEQGTFREDLFYRLNVLTLEVPPLRERREDILELARYFLQSTSKRLGRKGCTISKEVGERLIAYSWPGNVRELENVMERAVALAAGEALEEADLPEELRDESAAVEGLKAVRQFSQAKEQFEKDYLLEALEQCGGNMTSTAQATGIPRQNLYLKLKKHGINPEEARR